MIAQLDIDPLLHEYLEQRRGLTAEEIAGLLREWNQQGSLTDFLASKALIDRTTARMLITAQKGYLSSTEQELRTVLGIKHKPRRAKVEQQAPASAEPPPEVTPPTQPNALMLSRLAAKEEARPDPITVDDAKEPPPAVTTPKTRKSSPSRRGFLGASDEEMRHILGAKSIPAPRKDEPKPAVVAASEVPPIVNPAHSDPSITLAHSEPNLSTVKPVTPRAEPKVGTYLDRYYLEESLGEGATAHIFRSFHKLLRIPVAIKVFKRDAMASDPIGAQRFLSEAQILIRLEHPNIVRVLDIAVHDDAPYIVFEYVGELSLQGMIHNMGHLPPLRVAQIGAQVTAALDVASSNGLLHRDVKPDNVLIRKDGLAKLADFGIATWKQSDGRTSDELARAGLISGTPQYISPEQIMTPDLIDLRADMYSLGATLYHAACGHPPFECESLDELLHAQLEETPVSLITLDPNFDFELSEIIDQMLRKEPRERFGSLSEIRKRLEVAASRIQSEVTQRRRHALTSGAMPSGKASEDPSGAGFTAPSVSGSTDRAHTLGSQHERTPQSAQMQSAGSQRALPSDSQLQLRETSLALRIGMLLIAMLMIGLLIYVLARSPH